MFISRGRDLVEHGPVRSALVALCSESSRIGTWVPDEQRPLAEVKEAVGAFLRSTNVIERGQTPWLSARARLRDDPHAELAEFDALLSDVTD